MTDLPVADFGMGRLVQQDWRDLNHLMSAQIPEQVTSTSRVWIAPHPSNQGSKPHCVGHAWRHFLLCAPTVHWGHVDRVIDAANIYSRAQVIDEWPGEDYDGTSVRAGAKILQEEGVIGEYFWAMSESEIRKYVLERGPVVMGTNWHRRMFTPDENGYVVPIGPIDGGHAWTCIGYSNSRQAYRGLNSWGIDWGQKGRFWIKRDDMSILLHGGGEACSTKEIYKKP